MKEPLHFAHGNGFPALCYSQLLQVLQTRYTCSYIDRIGHRGDFPVTDNWHYLVEEIIDNITRHHDTPVIAVGHSLGGVLSLLAAAQAPELFRAVVLIDSPVWGPMKSMAVRLAKFLGLIDRITPAFQTKGRRQHWHTQEEVRAYLKTRDLFKTFSDRCLQDYIDFGLYQANDGFRLRFDPLIEYSIFRTIPHHLPEKLKHSAVPAALIYGKNSKVVSAADMRYMTSHYPICCYPMEGSHMLPMEHPHALGELIFKAIDNLRLGNQP